MLIHENFDFSTVKCLLALLRDGAIDQSLKLTVVESFIRILLSEKYEHPEDFICAMIL
jgi:hypothetical protein